MPTTPTDRRIELQYKLEEVLGTNKVWFRPPENIKLSFPCIIYNLRTSNMRYADNKTYSAMRCYDIQLIHKTADTNLIEDLLNAFPYISFENSFTVENLIHENFILYY